MPGLDFLAEELAALEERGRSRSLRTVDGPQDRVVVLDGRPVLNFSSNNYLGLANHPRLVAAAAAALQALGAGAGASRLIVGSQRAHADLEADLASFHGVPAALAFNSGYHANVGVIPALAGAGDVIFSDALNHASIIDGCRMSRARIVVYPHRDVAALAALLREHGSARRRFIITDTVFSMDGDLAPLVELADVAERHRAALMVDEAHATGVLGPDGRGAAAAAGVSADVHVGTLGKALGSFGAYVAGSATLVQFLVNRARSFVFTTALPAATVTASREAVAFCKSHEGASRRSRLSLWIERFRDHLRELDLLAPGAGATPIFPVVVGEDRAAMECSRRLLDAGIYAQGIRPPTVPRGTSRLRFALMATHTEEDLAAAIEALRRLADSGLLPRRNT